MKHLVKLASALALVCLNIGCAVDVGDVDSTDAEALRFDDAADFGATPNDDAALDAVSGEELAVPSETSKVALSDDREGPDPTPWRYAGDGEGPDPTPWREGIEAGLDPAPWHHSNDDDDDTKVNAADGMGPDPTPWRRSEWGTEDHPWVQGEVDDEEPDPQPWQAAHVNSGNSDD